MRAEILCIGTELLLGHTVNTNSSDLSRWLAESGIEVYHHSVVGDNAPRIQQALRLALSRSDVVLVTGGLGPTVDDITIAAIAQGLGRPLVFHPNIFSKIRARFRKAGAPMAPEVRRQALLPQGGRAIDNPVGTAPGMILEEEGRLIITLPGVPSELTSMMEGQVLPYLRRRFPSPGILLSRTLKLTGLPESTVNHRVKDVLKLSGAVTVGIYAHLLEVDLRITAKASSEKGCRSLIRPIDSTIRRRLGRYVFGADEETLEEIVVQILRRKRKTLCIAESCTGGLISDRLTDVSGASRILDSTLVTYSNASKRRILGVAADMLDRFGAVSAPCARAMALGAVRTAQTDYALSVTGICGPTGGTPKKPVGLVFMGLAGPRGVRIRRLMLLGDRREIKLKASQIALDWLRLTLTTT